MNIFNRNLPSPLSCPQAVMPQAVMHQAVIPLQSQVKQSCYSIHAPRCKASRYQAVMALL